MVPENVMSWIAGGFPVFSFVAGFCLYLLTRKTWLATVVVFAVTLGSMLMWFSMHFWSWLLLYLFVCWLGCWAGYYVLSLRAQKRTSVES